jgi:UDP-glucuronate 4-epimerase
MKQKILVTGSAGFIGFHLTEKLLQRGDDVVGIDNLNDYYNPKLKLARLAESGISDEAVKWHYRVNSTKYPGYSFIRTNLEDKQELMDLCQEEGFDKIINLAAQPGVRYSIEHPDAYVQANIVGFLNILEAARHFKVKHLVYASSSSVYGLNETMPFSVSHNVDHPVSLYAATKKSNELMAHAYSHLYNIPTSGLRFFTVYGPWGRPDMAYYSFADNIVKGEPIRVFNQGKMKRDFTYIDDIVKGIMNVLDSPAQPDARWSGATPDPSRSRAPYRIYNIGNNQPVELMKFIGVLGNALGIDPQLEFLDMQPGDVVATWADIEDLRNNFDYKPDTAIEEGIEKFAKWFLGFRKEGE